MSRGYRILLVSLILFLGIAFGAGAIFGNNNAVLDIAMPIALGVLYIGFVVGFFFIAADKGYPGILGVFLGLFSILGLFILVFLPEKSGSRGPSQSSPRPSQ